LSLSKQRRRNNQNPQDQQPFPRDPQVTIQQKTEESSK
jgi:hypothetical protein